MSFRCPSNLASRQLAPTGESPISTDLSSSCAAGNVLLQFVLGYQLHVTMNRSDLWMQVENLVKSVDITMDGAIRRFSPQAVEA
jgi:hypothetical protein